jgi:hypothetical protein
VGNITPELLQQALFVVLILGLVGEFTRLALAPGSAERCAMKAAAAVKS